MAAGQYHHDSSPEAFLMPGDMNLYDGTSSESSVGSPHSNVFDHVYGGNTYVTYPTYPVQYQPNGVPMGLIPVELDIEGLYEDHDRRRRKNGSEKIVASHVHSRRRAQNRASQRAFRDRKEKHMRDLEQRLGELEGRHNDLSRSYESLQVEYSSVKDELDRLRKAKSENASSPPAGDVQQSDHKAWGESRAEILDPLLFDVSTFCFEQEESGEQTRE